MASLTEIANVLAGAMADQITVALDSGSVGGIINIYDDTGTIPTDCEATNNTNVLLGTLLLSDPAFTGFTNPGDAGFARVTASAITSDTSADATGTATYFRGYSCDTAQIDANKVTCFIQGSAGVSGDTPDLTLDDKNIVIGGTIACTGWTIDIPES